MKFQNIKKNNLKITGILFSLEKKISSIKLFLLIIIILFVYHDSSLAQGSFGYPLVFVSRNHLTGGNVLFPSAGLLPGMGAHSRFAVTGGKLMIRESNGTIRTLIDSTMTFGSINIIDIQQPCVNWDCERILFAGIENRDSSWRIYEIKKDGTGFRKITNTDRFIDLSQFGTAAYRFFKYDDIDPVYLPDGKIIFSSTRFPTISEFGSALTTNLFIVDSTGQNMFRITTERNGAEKPTIDPLTGRIIYSRWWLNADMPSNLTASGVTRDAALALSTDKANIWEVNIINPDGDMVKLYASDPRKRNTLFSYRPRLLNNGDLLSVFLPHTPMVITGGSTGIRNYTKGLSEYKQIAGVDTNTALYVVNPPSTGSYMPPYAVDPLPLPDGRILFSMANTVEQQDYGIYVCNSNGTGILPVLDFPNTLELNAELLIVKVKPPIPEYIQGYDTNKVPPTENPLTFFQGGFFRFDCMNIYTNAPVDVPINDAPPISKNARFRFFLNFQRQNSNGLDLPILYKEITVRYDGKILEPDMPANVPLFEQVTDSARRVLVNSKGNVAHVTGMNFGINGSGTKCVGCHAGHSLIPVPVNNTEAQFTNVSTSASVTESSFRVGKDIAFRGKNVVDRKARNTDLSVNWIAEGGSNEYVELQWALPIDVREIKLYNIFPNPSAGTNILVNDCEIFLYKNNSVVGHIPSTGVLNINGKSIMINPVTSIDRMKIIVKSFSGTIGGSSSAGLAEVETIARITIYQTTGIRNNNITNFTYKLEQNYPNPFNPSTKIRFEVPLSKGGLKGVVSLKVFDIIGREIATLVNEQLQPGSYEVIFDAEKLPSGIYFYKINVDNYTNTKRMLLIK
jgi:hypothetical protein